MILVVFVTLRTSLRKLFHVNKYIGLLVPLGLTIGGSVVFCLKEEKKALGFSALGLIIYAVTFWANLR